MTLFIVEMAQSSSLSNEAKDLDGLSLFGMVTINKRLILQVT